MTARLIVEAYNPSPGPSGSVIVTGSGGGWTAGDYCFRAVAWYDPTGAETNIDRCGINRSAVAAWDNITVGTNNQVSLTFTRPTIGDTNEPLPYHHISLYALESSTPDFTVPWTKLAETTSRLQLTFAVPDDVDLGADATFNATGARVNILPVIAPTIVQPKMRHIKVAAGIPLPVSLGADVWAERIRFGVTYDALLHSECSRLLAWEHYAVHCILVETEEASAEVDAPVTTWEGFFVDSAFVHRHYSAGEEPGGRFFDFLVTKTGLASTLPITDPTP